MSQNTSVADLCRVLVLAVGALRGAGHDDWVSAAMNGGPASRCRGVCLVSGKQMRATGKKNSEAYAT
ncbi:hypothetical protein ABIB77_007396 [Bradyrhizobium sp. i1.14.1]